jgi:hypothetical protein
MNARIIVMNLLFAYNPTPSREQIKQESNDSQQLLSLLLGEIHWHAHFSTLFSRAAPQSFDFNSCLIINYCHPVVAGNLSISTWKSATFELCSV